MDSTIAPGHFALRKGRVSIPGHAYLITCACLYRRRRFESCEPARAVCRVLGDCRVWRDASAIAWVLMPDHMHALIRLGENESLSDVMRRVNSLTARAANSASNQCGQVWQSTYHDHALRREQDLSAVVRYVVGNPLRAGLVSCVGDYPYWNCNNIDAL